MDLTWSSKKAFKDEVVEWGFGICILQRITGSGNETWVEVSKLGRDLTSTCREELYGLFK